MARRENTFCSNPDELSSVPRTQTRYTSGPLSFTLMQWHVYTQQTHSLTHVKINVQN